MDYELELQTRINEVLHYIWDPIGVRGEPWARDEYDSYVPAVYSLLQDGASADQIAAHLDRIATDRTGLNSNMKHALLTAQNLLGWRSALLEIHSAIPGNLGGPPA